MNLPNKITLTRIFMIPVFVVLFYVEFPYHEIVAAAVFLLAAFTDFLDGHIARKYHLVTNLGKFLDPIADKVLVSTALILLLTRPAVFLTGGLAGWGIIAAGVAVALILARELIVSGFRLIAVERGLVLAADFFGKIKTVLQDVSVAVLLVAMPFLGGTAGEVLSILGFSLFGACTVATVASGIHYIVANRAVLKEERPAEQAERSEDDGEGEA